MGCPSWCTFQLWATIFTVILGLFLIVAIAAPWYGIVVDDINTGNEKHNELLVSFWWPGVVSAWKTAPPGLKSSETTKWSDLESDKPKTVYMAANAITIVALVATLFLGCVLLFGLTINPTRGPCTRMWCGKTKWFAFALAVLVLILVTIAWALFFSFNSALDDADLCPSNLGLGKDEDMWCSSFVGTETITGDTKVSWAPSVGWIFALISSVWALVVVILTSCVKSSSSSYELL